jgi:hypothetical protein
MPVAGIPTIGRNTQGVRLIRLEPAEGDKEAEKVVAMERIAEKEEGGEVAPEVAAARAELATQPLAEEDLGDEAEAEAEDEGEEGDEGPEGETES